MSMIGWDQITKDFDKNKVDMARNSQRHISSGIGHHLARMMKGHI